MTTIVNETEIIEIENERRMCLVRSNENIVGNLIKPESQKALGSPVMSLDNDSQQLANNEQRNRGDNKTIFELQETISPDGDTCISKHLKSAPKHLNSNTLHSTSTMASKIDKKEKRDHPIIIVQHNYHDHSQEKEIDHPPNQKSRGGVSIPFPLKLHGMLDKAMTEGHGDIVSWQPHGRCFVVHKSHDFQNIVLPKYFKLSKLSSFQRQLNLYGFQRLTLGRDRGGYYHELFLRNKEFLARDIKRVQVKGTGVRARSNPEQEPNFWTLQWSENNFADAISKDETERTTSIGGDIDHIDHGIPSTLRPYQETNLWSMQWCGPKVFTNVNNERTGIGGVFREIPSAWNASIYREERNDQVTSTFPILKSIQPIETTRRPYSTPCMSGYCDTLPNHNIDVRQHGSRTCGCSMSARAEDGNLVLSFGDKAFHYFDPFEDVCPAENKNFTNNGIVTNNLYAGTPDHLPDVFDSPAYGGP